MAITATNPSTGQRLILSGDQWMPFEDFEKRGQPVPEWQAKAKLFNQSNVQTATNPETGEKVFLDSESNQWVPMPANVEEKPEGNILSDIPKSLVRGLDVAGESIGGAMKMLGVPGGGYVKELYGERAKRPEIARPEYLQDGTVIDKSERLVDPRWWVNMAGENLPNMLIMMAPGAAAFRGAKAVGMGLKGAKAVATGGAAAGAFTIESGSAYNDAKEEMLKMGYSEEAADKIATAEGLIVGTVNSLLEVAPFNILLKNPGGKKILARIVRQGLWEGGTEAVQENVNMLAAKLGHSPDVKTKDWIGRTVESGLAGFALGGGAGVFGGVRGAKEPAGKPGTGNQAVIDRLKADIQSGKLSPAVLKAMRERATDDFKPIIDQALSEQQTIEQPQEGLFPQQTKEEQDAIEAEINRQRTGPKVTPKPDLSAQARTANQAEIDRLAEAERQDALRQAGLLKPVQPGQPVDDTQQRYEIARRTGQVQAPEKGGFDVVPSTAIQMPYDGPTATNPETGERIALKDGKWVPIAPEIAKGDGNSTAQAVNKEAPGNGVKYDGIQEGFESVPDTYQFTALEGPAKGATFNVESLEPETVKAKLNEMIELRKPRAAPEPITPEAIPEAGGIEQAPEIEAQVEPKAKEPWEQTRNEYGVSFVDRIQQITKESEQLAKSYGEAGAELLNPKHQSRIARQIETLAKEKENYTNPKWIERTHKKSVEQAIREGKIQSHPDYPDLITPPKVSTETAEPPKVKREATPAQETPRAEAAPATPEGYKRTTVDQKREASLSGMTIDLVNKARVSKSHRYIFPTGKGLFSDTKPPATKVQYYESFPDGRLDYVEPVYREAPEAPKPELAKPQKTKEEMLSAISDFFKGDAKPGKAWIDNQQRPIYAVSPLKGKRNAGKVMVTLAQGKRAKIEESKIIERPTEAGQAKPEMPGPPKKGEPNLYGTAKAFLAANIDMGEPIIARDKVGDTEYEFRIARVKDPDAPQMTHRAEMRRVGGTEWESAMVGMATSKKNAMRFLAERYDKIGDIDKLEVLDDNLKEFVDKQIESKRAKEAEAEKERKEKESEQKAIAEEMRQMQEREPLISEEMKKAKATKGKIKIKTAKDDDITPTQIDANIIGDFAYHKVIGGGEHYSITHIPSGLGLDRDLTLKDARELTYRLSFVQEKWDGKGGPPEDFRKSLTSVNKALRNRDLISKPAPAETAEEPAFTKRQMKPVDVESPEFKAWFKGSKVVDSEGKPLRVYHGTQATEQVEKLIPNFKPWNQVGIFLTKSKQYAASYGSWDFKGSETGIPVGKTKAHVLPLYARIENPLDMTKKEGRKTWADLKSKFNKPPSFNDIKDAGYDGIIWDKWEITVFDDTQIKSAISNTGAFSSTDPRIQFQKRTIPESTGKYPKNRLEKIIARRTRGWTNKPEIQVVEKQSELPQKVLDAIGPQDIVDAVLYQGTAYLVAENLGGPKHALNALFHESFGEHGLRLLEADPNIGPQYKAFEDGLLRTEKAEIEKVAKEYELDLSNPREASIAAKEYLSREAAKEAMTSPIRKLIRLIARWLNRIAPTFKLQKEEVRQWLRDARRMVEKGAPRGTMEEAPAFTKEEKSATVSPMTSKEGPGSKDITTPKTPESPKGGPFKVKTIDIDEIEYAHPLNHELSEESVKWYKNLRGETIEDPIIITADFKVLDGSGRYNNALFNKEKNIKVIQIPLEYDEITAASDELGRSTDALRAEISKVVYEKHGYLKRTKQIVDETDYAYDGQALELLDAWLPNPSRQAGEPGTDTTSTQITAEQVRNHFEFDSESENADELAQEMADYINGLPEKITVYRAVSAEDLKQVETGEFIGEHWTPSKDAALEFARQNIPTGKIFVIKGTVSKTDVDLVRSAALNSISPDENELFIPGKYDGENTIKNIQVVDTKTAQEPAFTKRVKDQKGQIVLREGLDETDALLESYFGKEAVKSKTTEPLSLKPQKNINIEASTKSKIAFETRRIDLSKEGIKNLASKVYTTFFMQEYPVARFAERAGNLERKQIEEQIRRVRGTGGIVESILTAGSKTPFINLAKDGVTEYSHLGETSLQKILNPLKSKETYQDYERLREAERDLAFDKFRKEDIESGKLKGIDPENATAVIRLLKSKYGADGFKRLQDISREHTRFEQDAVLKTLLKSGWMSQESYDAITDRPESEFYASYLREMEDVEKENVGGGGDPVKKIYGSEKRKIPSTEGTISNILRAVRLVEKLRLNKEVVALKDVSEDLAKEIIERKPRFKSVEITFPQRDANNHFVKDKDGNRVYKTRKVAVPVGPPADTITIAENGKKKYYEIPNDVLKALNNYHNTEVNVAVKLMRQPARLLRAGATLSAEFIMRNPVRDQFSAFVYSKYGYNPFIDLPKGIFNTLGRTDLYNEFKAAGGENSFFVSLDRQAVNMTAKDMTGQGNLIKYVKNPVEALRILSELSEKGTRVGLYAKARKKGATTQEAATEAREGTLDFGRIGSEKALNQMIAFWNASLQGADKLIRSGKSGKAISRAILGITLPSIILWGINHDDDRYKELPAWRKNFFWNIITDGPIISIPKPFELGIIFGSLPERILDWLVLKDPEGMKDVAGAMAEGVLPSLIPTAALPVIEHITNYSFFRGQTLEPRSMEGLPNWLRYGQHTTNIAKKAGKLIDVSPIKLENWIRDWTGTLGYGALSGLDKLFMGDDIPDVGRDWYEIAPGIKGFISREPIGSGSKSVELFYNNAKEALSAEAGYKLLAKSTPEEAVKYAKKQRELISLAKGARGELTKMSAIRQNIQRITDSKTIASAQKRKQVDQLNEMITQRAKMFNKVYEKITKGD